MFFFPGRGLLATGGGQDPGEPRHQPGELREGGAGRQGQTDAVLQLRVPGISSNI